MNNKKVYKDIVYHIKKEKPFSLIRFGDADLKLMKILLKKKEDGISLYKAIDKYAAYPDKMKLKFIRQGIREEFSNKLIDIYRDSANNANYVSGFDIWFSNSYWEKNKRRNENNLQIIKNWKKLYKKIGIENTSYCSPDISFFLFFYGKNLLNNLNNKKVCLITPWKNVEKRLNQIIDVKRINIPPLLNIKSKPPKIWHCDIYKDKLKEIEEMCGERKIFLVGAGNIGRGYSNYIKKCGGIAIDIGKVMDAWDRGFISPRLRKYIKIKNNFNFELTKEGRKYEN